MALFHSLQECDNAELASLIRAVSAEYGLTPDKGYSVADPTLDCLSQVYSASNSHYWVVKQNERIVGGAGIAPVANETGICELQKMYFLPEARGKGIAHKLALHCFDFARQAHFHSCYLETTYLLPEALKLYQRLGFTMLAKPIGNTGHDACEIPMILKL